jgi:hypothetical protein
MCVVCVQRPGHIYRSLMLHRVIYIYVVIRLNEDICVRKLNYTFLISIYGFSCYNVTSPLLTWFITRVTRWVPHVGRELLTLPYHLRSPPVFSRVRVSRSLIFCVIVVCPFPFCHCIVCPSSIYGIWLPLWYLRFTVSDYLFGIFNLFLNDITTRTSVVHTPHYSYKLFISFITSNDRYRRNYKPGDNSWMRKGLDCDYDKLNKEDLFHKFKIMVAIFVHKI